MTDATAALLLAAMIGTLALLTLIGALVLNRRLGAIGSALRREDARLTAATPLLADRFVAGRSQMTASNAAVERTLWWLSRADGRLDSINQALVTRRTELDRQRSRLVAARASFVRIRRTMRMLIRVIELRRAIL
jgi:alpha-D-ribose 1-methylphosphonate 5-triphosphate synthase subunit PhnG